MASANRVIDNQLKERSTTVGTTAIPVPSAANKLKGRRSMLIHNVGASTIEIGSSTLTFGTGIPIGAGDEREIIVSDKVDVYAICDTGGSADVRTLEGY